LAPGAPERSNISTAFFAASPMVDIGRSDSRIMPNSAYTCGGNTSSKSLIRGETTRTWPAKSASNTRVDESLAAGSISVLL